MAGGAGASAEPAERITRFASRIAVHGDASMTVEETIAVVSAGAQIKRGIYRDFPTTYRDPWGHRYVVEFTVLSVERDDAPESYHTEQRANGLRVYIGQRDVFLSPGAHTYRLTYRTTRQLGFFKDHDELYWNVTGTGWIFPIDEATARVTLPRSVDASDLRLEGYTGPQGAKGQAYRASVDSDSAAVVTTTRPLMPYEGLTIVVGFPKRVVAEPSTSQRLGYVLQDNRSLIVGLISIVVLLLYYLWVWSLVGRDPPKGAIVVQYEPPDEISPAALRYIRRMGFDQKTFAASVIDMAVKGYCTISEQKGIYTLAKRRDDIGELSPDEQQVAEKLLGTRQTIELKDEHYVVIGGALQAAKRALTRTYERHYFLTNSGYFVFGVLLSLAAAAVCAMTESSTQGGEAIWSAMILGMVGAQVGIVVFRVYLFCQHFLIGRVWMGRFVFIEAVVGLLVLGMIGAFLASAHIMGGSLSLGMALLAVMLVGLNGIFYHLLKAFTPIGRKFMDRVEGFRMYLAAVEQDRLNVLNPPQKTPELFEKFLPYALALDVEQQWAEQFTEVLAAAGTASQPYVPGWYTGSDWRVGSVGAFAGSLGSAFTSAIASSSTAPGSSSGGGGGGSSGGGGGGGGGGGW